MPRTHQAKKAIPKDTKSVPLTGHNSKDKAQVTLFFVLVKNVFFEFEFK